MSIQGQLGGQTKGYVFLAQPPFVVPCSDNELPVHSFQSKLLDMAEINCLAFFSAEINCQAIFFRDLRDLGRPLASVLLTFNKKFTFFEKGSPTP